jgi:hypothetical protein
MQVNVVGNPVDIFLDSNGQPLQGGSIYIGQPSTDPTNPANQITVYQDSALSIPFQQPIKTINGQPSLNGTQAVVYLGLGTTAYSLAVLNAGGVVVMSLPNVQPFSLGGSAGGNMVPQEFVSGVGFTPGVTTQLTLSSNFGSGANIWVDFDGTPQHYPDDFSINGTTLTFTSPIPVGVQKVYTKGGITTTVGAPGAGTVGDSQLQWIGILFRSVDSIASLRTLAGSSHDRAYVVSYYGIGTPGGGGPFYKDPNDTTSTDNGGTVIVGSDGTRWKRTDISQATFCQFGAKGDGANASPTDDTTAIQNCITAMAGKLAIPDAGKKFYCAGIMLTGATYNNTSIRGAGVIMLKPDAGASNFGGAWVGMVLQQCDGVTLDLKFDGNRAAMTAREQIFCVGLAGATNVKIPYLEANEIRGDGLYIGQANWTASSANTINVEIGLIKGANTADDGRNLVSIISGQAIHIKRAQSTAIGGVINGVVEPGGVDIEPDQGYETVYDVRIDSLDVTTAGTSGFSILGKSVSGNDANLDWNCTQIVIGEARILRTGTSGSALGGSGFNRCADVKIIKGFYQFNSTPGAGPLHDLCQRVEADWTVTNVTYGAWLGATGTVYQGDFKLTVNGFTQAGVQVTSLQQTRVRGRMFSSVGGNTTYGVHATNNGRSITQQNVAYEIDAPYDNVMAQAFYNDTTNPVTFGAGCIARNCDWSSYPSYAATTNALIPLQDVIGMTWAAAQPTNGTWHWQTRVKNTQPAVATNKTTDSWARLNSGSNNATGTDWVALVCTNS